MERRLGAFTGRARRLDPARQVDLAVAAGATVLGVAGALRPDPELAYDLEAGLLPALAGAAAGVVLLWRRSHALLVFSLVLLVAFATTVLSWQSQAAITLFLAGYALGAYATFRAGVAGLALAGLAFGVLMWLRAPYFDTPLGWFAAAEVVVSWVVGYGVAHRRRLADLARERRRRLIREGAQEAERAVLAERLRMARLLHARVATSLEEIIREAGAAHRSGAAEQETLATIEGGTRAALDDLRRMLGTLRDPDERPPLPRAPARAPADWPVDVALGLGVVVLNVGGVLLPETSSARETAEPVLPVLLALAVVPGLALMLRRRIPVTVLAVVFTVIATVFWLDWPEGNLPAALVIAAYAVGAWAPVWRGAEAMVVMFSAMLLLDVLAPATFAFDWLMVLFFTPPWVVGVALRWRRLRDRAAIDAALAAEAEQAATVQRALVEQRLAVARDLHDVVSHNLSGIVLSVAAARRRAGASESGLLGVVEQAGRDALAGLREMVEALESPAATQPAPGLSEIEALVARHGERHGPISLRIDPAVAAEPESTRVTTYRLVQEALTNVAKHAPGARVSVAVLAGEEGVRVIVANEAARSTAVELPTSGVGLEGLRERVALFGGEFEAGADGEGGFAVRARLPRAVPA